MYCERDSFTHIRYTQLLMFTDFSNFLTGSVWHESNIVIRLVITKSENFFDSFFTLSKLK